MRGQLDDRVRELLGTGSAARVVVGDCEGDAKRGASALDHFDLMIRVLTEAIQRHDRRLAPA
jgi:hypothetical protein